MQVAYREQENRWEVEGGRWREGRSDKWAFYVEGTITTQCP